MRRAAKPAVPSGYRALRKGRRALPGQVYLVTTVSAGRRSVFTDHTAARAAAKVLASDDWREDAELLAWVLMPDHLHLLLHLGEAAGLSQLLMRLKSLLARSVNLTVGQNGRVWQRGFHDRALRRDEDVVAAARYMVANPLRAGLVEAPGHYPYWDAIWLNCTDPDLPAA